MKNQTSIDIERPIEEVFELTNNHAAEWSLVVVDEHPLDGGRTGVGARSQIVTEERGQRMEFESTVTAWEPPNQSSIQMNGKMFDINATYDFVKLSSNQTRVTQTSEVRGKGLMRIFFILFGPLMKKSSCDAGLKEMQSLKQFCEQQVSAAS